MRSARSLLAALALLTAAAVGAHGPVEAPLAPPTKINPNLAARDQTLSLIDAYQAYLAAGPGERGQRLAVLLAVARDRKANLAAMIDTDPAEVLRVTLPASIRAGMPPEVAALVEQDAVEEGELEVLHFDFPDPAANRYDYHLRTAKGRVALHFAVEPPTELVTGTKVRARGLRIDAALAVESSAALEVTKASALPNTLGAQKTLAILVNFSDAPSQPFTVASANTVMFTTTSNYDYEASYQQTWLTGDVAGWFTIASTSTTCDYTTIASQAEKAATAAGYSLSNYSRRVYVMSGNACGWWGLGTVGGNPSQAWVNSKYGFSLPVVGHEMGHNFGLYHSHSLDCGAVSFATSGCSASEYGDTVDMMGNNGTTPHYNAFQKERLGWLNAGVSPPIIVASGTSGTATYAIGPMADPRSTTPRAIKIPQSDSCTSPQKWLYVESRQGKGFDSFVGGNANLSGGVLVHQVTEGNADSSYLLDMTPATASWSDPALVAGVAYTDPVRGVVITPLSVTATGSTVSVSVAGAACTHVAPVVSMAPTATQYTSAGKTVTYSVTVTNKDGCGCAASTFDVSGTVPSGWSSSSARTGSIAPGSSGSTSVLMTVSGTEVAGFYPVRANAANSTAPAVTASAGGTVAVISSLTAAPTTDKSVYTLPSKRNQAAYVTITTKVTSSSGAVANAAVVVQVTDPTGKVASYNATSGTTGLATVTHALKARTSPTGSYSVSSKATVGSMSATGVTTFVVQ